MKKLMVFTLYDEKGASSQYRAFQFREELEKHFDTRWMFFWDDKYVTKYMRNKRRYVIPIIVKYVCAAVKRWYELTFEAPKADVILLQKASIPKVEKHFLEKAKRAGTRIVFDVDDAIYLNKRDNSDKIASIADVVICGNDTLKNYYIKYNENCSVIPTTDKTPQYEKYWDETFSNKIIGWIGSKTTIGNLDLVVAPINNLVKKHPEVEFHIISDDCLDFEKRISNCYLEKWDKETYLQKLATITVGIMPLLDTTYNRGKCGFKLIQYLNMRKPVIGSGIGVNAKIISDRGIVANTEDEWEIALEKLLYDEDLYTSYLTNIDKSFFEEYGYTKIVKMLLKEING